MNRFKFFGCWSAAFIFCSVLKSSMGSRTAKESGSRLLMRIRALSRSRQAIYLIETRCSAPSGCHVGVCLVETKCRLTSFVFLQL